MPIREFKNIYKTKWNSQTALGGSISVQVKKNDDYTSEYVMTNFVRANLLFGYVRSGPAQASFSGSTVPAPASGPIVQGSKPMGHTAEMAKVSKQINVKASENNIKTN